MLKAEDQRQTTKHKYNVEELKMNVKDEDEEGNPKRRIEEIKYERTNKTKKEIFVLSV